MASRVKTDRIKKGSKGGDLFGGSSRLASVTEESKLHCAVPFVICVRKGEALPKSIADRGVKMCCTNEKCPLAKQFVHSECFEHLQSTLLKVIGNKGSARKWTEVQRKHNLWEKKGLTLIQKNLRCHCGMGLMTRDTDFYKESPTNDTSSVAVDAKSKEKRKKKDLPRLNFGYNNTTVTQTENAEAYKKKFVDLDSHFLSSHRYDSDNEEYEQISSLGATELGSVNCQRKDYGYASSFETPKRHIQSSSPWNNTHAGDHSTSSGWRIVPSAAPTTNAWKKNSPQLTLRENAQTQSSPLISQISSDWTNRQCSDTPLQTSWTSVVQSSAQPGVNNNNKSAQKSVYTLFGSKAPSFWLGERILAECFLPRRSSR